jgi:hypothetical protein
VPPSRTPDTARVRLERRRKVAGYAIIIALGSLLVGTLVSSGSGSGSGGAASTTTSVSTTTQPATTTSVDPATLPPAAKELYALIQQGRATGYHVVLSVTGSALPTRVTEASIEVWRLGPRVRHDTRLVDSSGTTITVDIGGPDGSVQCDALAGGDLTCKRTSTNPIGPDDDFLGFLVQTIASSTVEGRDDTVGGTAARCYRIGGADGTELCLTAGGLPLRIAETTFVEEARVVEPTVDPAVFQPPAPVG